MIQRIGAALAVMTMAALVVAIPRLTSPQGGGSYVQWA